MATAGCTDLTFLALADSSEDAVVRMDRAMRYLYVNPGFEKATGRRPADVLGRTPMEVGLPRPIIDALRDAIERVFGGERAVTFHSELTLPGRASRWFSSRCVPEYDRDGSIVAMVIVGRDVTDRVHIEAALEESEIRFQAIFENVPVGMAVSTAQAHGYMTNANSAVSRMLGYTRAELAQMHFSEFTHPDDVELDARLLAEIGRGERDSYSIEKRYFRKDGTMFWVHLTVSAVRDAKGALRYVVGMTEDISERKAIESELRTSEERFRALVEHSSDLIGILEMDGRIRYVSPSQTRLLGYTAEELAGTNAFTLVHPDDVERVHDRLAEARMVGSLAPERPIRFRSRDGSWRSLMVTVSDMHDSPAVGGYVINARDVTRELRLQEQLTQAQKMEALGQLAGGVAHDFNNILAIISGYAELLRLDLHEDSPAMADVQEIVKATVRGAGVTKQLLAFSRRQAIETEVLDLAAVVHDTARMLRALLPASIELRVNESDARAVPVRAARAQVEQILLNLAVNARDAMPGGGTLRIDIGRGPTSREAVVAVADTGTGMTEEVRTRVFEPFFTTKPLGRGTGLGLATVYGLVRQFGGRIEVDSAPGAGTTFTVSLPLADAQTVPAIARTGEHAAAPRGARILLAEDEAQLRAAIERALTRRGYSVSTAPDGAAALAAIESGTAFDLVISDVAMPRMGGRELAATLARARPDLPVVLMSGYAEIGDQEGADALPGNVAAFVEKPFDVARLLDIAAGVLSPVTD